MLTGNQMEKQMVKAGYEPMKPKRPRKSKQFNCNKCNSVMRNDEWNNFLVCPKCDSSFFIFLGKIK